MSDLPLIVYATGPDFRLPAESADRLRAAGINGVLILPPGINITYQELHEALTEPLRPEQADVAPLVTAADGAVGRCPTRSAVRDGMPQCELKLNHGGPHRYPGQALGDDPAEPRTYRGKRRAGDEPDPWAEGTGDGYSVPNLRAGLEAIRDACADHAGGIGPDVHDWCDRLLNGWAAAAAITEPRYGAKQ